MVDSYFAIYNIEAFTSPASGGSTTADVIAARSGEGHKWGDGEGVGVETGSAFTGNTATIHISDGAFSPTAGADDRIDDSGNTDQVLGSALSFPGSSGSDSYAAGLYVQAEASQLMEIGEGVDGIAIFMQISNDPASGDTTTGGGSIIYGTVVCFEENTRIATSKGPVPAGKIAAGDRGRCGLAATSR